MLRLLAGLLAVAMVTVLMDRYSLAGPQQPRLPARSFSSEPAPGAKANNLFWVIQASGSGWRGVEGFPAFQLQRVKKSSGVGFFFNWPDPLRSYCNFDIENHTRLTKITFQFQGTGFLLLPDSEE